MKKYGLQMSFNDKNIINLKKTLKKINWKKNEEKIIKARRELNINLNMIRLEQFFEKIILDFKHNKIYKRNG